MGDDRDGDRLRGLWDKYAPRYDRNIAFVERIQFGGGREWVCSQAEGDVLEVAIGTGRNLAFYPAGAVFTGIDLSPAMLEIARRRAADLGRDVTLHEADAEALDRNRVHQCTVPRRARCVESCSSIAARRR
jgi:ubiquinone/menaquinone biosynthesis C-methylase UbiE